MSWLIIGICLFLAAAIGGRAFMDADPKALANGLRLIGGLVLGIGGLFLSLRGLAIIGIPIGLFGLGIIARVFGWQGLSGIPFLGPRAEEPSAGGASDVRTAHLEMSLDHDSGAIDGRILKDEHAGARLSELDRDTLAGLWRTWSGTDPDAARLLETYLDRVHGSDWRAEEGEEAEGGARRRADGRMSEAEALEILELRPGASADEVREAHRRLMKRHHPDQGGPKWYATKLNEARDRLLKS